VNTYGTLVKAWEIVLIISTVRRQCPHFLWKLTIANFITTKWLLSYSNIDADNIANHMKVVELIHERWRASHMIHELCWTVL
jgi:hypothetical protein